VLAAGQPPRNNPAMHSTTLRAGGEHLGGCYTCRYFGEPRDPAVWYAKPGDEHVRLHADRGCAFWERQPGPDDAVPFSLGEQGR